MRITAAHGSGGKDTALLMQNLFQKHFGNSILNKLEDAAILDSPERIAVTTDSFVVTPLFFPGGDIGKLSICGTLNDLLVMGAAPKYLACGFILEEGLDFEQLEEIISSIAREAAVADVLIVAGDTKVAGSNGGLFINTTGIGFMPEGRNIGAANCAPGDKVILSGSLGDHHACILSARMGIESSITSDCACLRDVTSALFESGAQVKAMRDVTRGGLATVLNELAAASGCLIRLWEESLPVRANVKAFSDLLGLDPLYMGNEGKLIAVVEGQDAEKALLKVRETEHGGEATVIGEVLPRASETRRGEVIVKTRLGGHRRLDMLIGEGLPRIC